MYGRGAGDWGPGPESTLAPARPTESPGRRLADLRRRVLAYEPSSEPRSQYGFDEYYSGHDDYHGGRASGWPADLVGEIRTTLLETTGGALVSELDAQIGHGQGRATSLGRQGGGGYPHPSILSTEAERARVVALIDRAITHLDRRVVVDAAPAPGHALHGRSRDLGQVDAALADLLAETRRARRSALPILARAGAGMVLARLMEILGISEVHSNERRIEGLAMAAGLDGKEMQSLIRLAAAGPRTQPATATDEAGFETLERTLAALVANGRLGGPAHPVR